MLREINTLSQSYKAPKRPRSPIRSEGKENDTAPQSPNVATTKKVAFESPGGTVSRIGADASPYKSSVNANLAYYNPSSIANTITSEPSNTTNFNLKGLVNKDHYQALISKKMIGNIEFKQEGILYHTELSKDDISQSFDKRYQCLQLPVFDKEGNAFCLILSCNGDTTIVPYLEKDEFKFKRIIKKKVELISNQGVERDQQNRTRKSPILDRKEYRSLSDVNITELGSIDFWQTYDLQLNQSYTFKPNCEIENGVRFLKQTNIIETNSIKIEGEDNFGDKVNLEITNQTTGPQFRMISFGVDESNNEIQKVDDITHLSEIGLINPQPKKVKADSDGGITLDLKSTIDQFGIKLNESDLETVFSEKVGRNYLNQFQDANKYLSSIQQIKGLNSNEFYFNYQILSNIHTTLNKYNNDNINNDLVGLNDDDFISIFKPLYKNGIAIYEFNLEWAVKLSFIEDKLKNPDRKDISVNDLKKFINAKKEITKNKTYKILDLDRETISNLINSADSFYQSYKPQLKGILHDADNKAVEDTVYKIYYYAKKYQLPFHYLSKRENQSQTDQTTTQESSVAGSSASISSSSRSLTRSTTSNSLDTLATTSEEDS